MDLQQNSNILLASFYYIFILAIFLALSTPNLGTLARYKVAFIPVMLVVILLANVKHLLERHVYASQIFKFIEDNSLKQIYYTDLDFNLKDYTLDLNARARDYQTMAKQLLFFQSLTDIIEKIDLNQAKVGKNKKKSANQLSDNLKKTENFIIFNLKIKFKPRALHKLLED